MSANLPRIGQLTCAAIASRQLSPTQVQLEEELNRVLFNQHLAWATAVSFVVLALVLLLITKVPPGVAAGFVLMALLLAIFGTNGSAQQLLQPAPLNSPLYLEVLTNAAKHPDVTAYLAQLPGNRTLTLGEAYTLSQYEPPKAKSQEPREIIGSSLT